MAFRTWGRVLLVALGVGVVAGAGQLGFAYGFGILRFARTFDATTTSQWTAQLAWVGWFTMVAAVAGAVVADRLARRYDYRPTLATRAALAAAAALGAGAVAPLSMQPARAAQVTSVDPVLATGLVAALGALVGLAAALAALSQSPISWNIAVLTGGIWLLALVSVMPSLGPTDPLPAVRLGVPDPAWFGAGTTQRLAVVTMPALALVAGALSGALARFRGHPTVVVASTGAVGPALLALAYLTAGPGDSSDKYQAAPYWGALIAVAAGALGSVLAAVMRWPLTAETAARSPLEPTEILQQAHPAQSAPDQFADARTEQPDETPTATRTVPPSDPGAGNWTDRPTEARAGTRTDQPAEPWATDPTQMWAGSPLGDDPADRPASATSPASIPGQRRSSETAPHTTAPTSPAGAGARVTPPEAPPGTPEPATEARLDPAFTTPTSPAASPSAAPASPTPPSAAPTQAKPPSAASTSPRAAAPTTSAPLPGSPTGPTTAPSGPVGTPSGPVESVTTFRPASTDPLFPAPAPFRPDTAPLRPGSEQLPSASGPERLPSGTGPAPRRPEPEWADPTLATLATSDYWPSTVDPREPFEERTDSGWDAFATAKGPTTPEPGPVSTPDQPGGGSTPTRPRGKTTPSQPRGGNSDAGQETGRTDGGRPVVAPQPLGSSAAFGTPEPVSSPAAFGTPEPVSIARPFATPEPISTPKRVTPPEPISTPRRFSTPEPVSTARQVAPVEPVSADRGAPPEPVGTAPALSRLGSVEMDRDLGTSRRPVFDAPGGSTEPTTGSVAPSFDRSPRPGTTGEPVQTDPTHQDRDQSSAADRRADDAQTAPQASQAAPSDEQRAEEKGEEPAGEKAARPRRGLFRRNRNSGGSAESASDGTENARTDPPAQREPRGRGRTERPVSETDEEYVDWVSGLGAPARGDDDQSRDDAPRRTLRSSGRHHAD